MICFVFEGLFRRKEKKKKKMFMNIYNIFAKIK